MATPSTQTRSRRDRPDALDVRRPQPVLVRVIAAARPSAGVSRHLLAHVDEVQLGRGPEPDASWQRRVEDGLRRLVLRIPDTFASRLHARLVRAGDRWVLEDAGSKNGLRANGRRARRHWLEDGDLFEVGETMFAFRAALTVAPAEPPDTALTPDSGPAPGLATVLPDLAAAFARLARVTRSPLPVLLRGETGTGKEVLARAYHQLSNRPGPLVTVNCGALPPTLIESSLFGHLRGAFTGAGEDRRGLIASADRGTLFLDEIAELPLPAQAALLRAVQNREVLPLGATRPLPLDVRIVAASNRNLGELAGTGAFRDDLLARLQGHELELPALRRRREDLGLLVAALWRRAPAGTATRLSSEAVWALLRHDWPHNVRELEQALVAARALASDVIQLGDLPPRVQAAAADRGESATDPEDDARRDELRALLALHAGNVSRVARALGTSRAQVHRLCDRFGFDASSFRPGR
jgi:transcriptional regulator of acetoin/glycerol metabolism